MVQAVLTIISFIILQSFLIIIGISPISHLDLRLINNNSSLTWSPPSFYSDDIPQGSITTYHVCVKSQDGSVIDVNTTDTFYQLTSNLTICGIYTASITAFVEQYSSLVTVTTEQYTGSKIILIIDLMYYVLLDYTIDILEHVVEFEKSGNSSIVEVQFIINVRINKDINDIAYESRSQVSFNYVIASYMVQQTIMLTMRLQFIIPFTYRM